MPRESWTEGKRRESRYARTKSEKPHRLLPPSLSLLNSQSTFPTAKALKPTKAPVALATSLIVTHAFVAMIFVIAFVPACNNFFWSVTGYSLQNKLARRVGTIALKDCGFTQTDFLKERVEEKKREVPRINDGRRCKSERLQMRDICISRREQKMPTQQGPKLSRDNSVLLSSL